MLANLTDNTIAVIKELVALWPQIKLALRLPGTITGSGAARVSRNASGIVIHVDPPARATTPTTDTRPFIGIVNGKEAGSNTYTADIYDLPRANLGASTAATDRGTKIFTGAILKDFFKSGDLWPDDVTKRTTVILFVFQCGVDGTGSSVRPVFGGFPIAFGGCDTSGGGDTTSGDDGGY